MSHFQISTGAELERARDKFPPIHSLHEGYAVLKEEVDELWDEIKSKTVDQERVFEELVQIAAMAQRIAEDCLINGRGGKP